MVARMVTLGLALFTLMAPSAHAAESASASGLQDQQLRTSTTLYVDITQAGETIRWAGTGYAKLNKVGGGFTEVNLGSGPGNTNGTSAALSVGTYTLTLT